jgi:predicted alpha/beta-fold hydrolase
MPVLPTPFYRPVFPFTNGHVQTVFPVLFRPDPAIRPRPSRLETADGDVLGFDWHPARDRRGRPRLAVVSHGLEGHARKKYVAGVARALANRGWDVLAWNQRGCGGAPNLTPRFYHSGATEDLHAALVHGLRAKDYAEAALVGFSLGGNQILKYLGEDPARVPSRVVRAVVFSVPCVLADSAAVLARPSNRPYMAYFLRGLRRRIREKARRFPAVVDAAGLEDVATFEAFDERYTAPLHGFAGAADYYARCSSRPFLPRIRVPTLLVNARDDPFLAPSCFPEAEARANPALFLEMPRAGGHVGFVRFDGTNVYWSERRAVAFLDGEDSSGPR